MKFKDVRVDMLVRFNHNRQYVRGIVKKLNSLHETIVVEYKRKNLLFSAEYIEAERPECLSKRLEVCDTNQVRAIKSFGSILQKEKQAVNREKRRINKEVMKREQMVLPMFENWDPRKKERHNER